MSETVEMRDKRSGLLLGYYRDGDITGMGVLQGWGYYRNGAMKSPDASQRVRYIPKWKRVTDDVV